MKQYTVKQKKMLREIESMINVQQIELRHEYVFNALKCLCRSGRVIYQTNYPSLSSQFSDEDLFFYERELVKRKERMLKLQELDELKMRKAGVIV